MQYSPLEQVFLLNQHHAILASCSDEMQPNITSVVVDFDGYHIFILRSANPLEEDHHDLIVHGTNQVARIALIIGELAEEGVEDPHGMKITGHATTVSQSGTEVFIVQPEKKWSWGINQPAYVNGKFIVEQNG